MANRHRFKNEYIDPDEILADSVSALGSSMSPEGKIEKSIGPVPAIIFLLIIGIGMGYLLARAIKLQVVSGETLFEQSQENRFLVRQTFAARGVLYDRNGAPLVENIPSFGLVFNRNEFLANKGDLTTLMKKLSITLDEPVRALVEAGFPEDNDSRKLPARIFILRTMPLERVVSLTPQLDALPGISIFESYQRNYSYPYAFAHLIGYTGKVSPDDLRAHPKLQGEETIGKDGIELFYDDLLRGTEGKKIVEVNSQGRETQFKLVQNPQEGLGLRLTVDSGLQRTAYDLLNRATGGKKSGSIIALDPRNGGVLALVNIPSFDANAMSAGMSQKEFNALVANPLKPFFDRAIAGAFPSGSIIKPLIAAAALEEHIIDPSKQIFTRGYIEVPNPYDPTKTSIFRDWKNHGWIDLYHAIAQSSDAFFYTIGGGYGGQQGLGIEKIYNYAKRFGLGSLLGIDLPGETAGFFPHTESKKITDPNDPVWRIGDTYNVSIGQGGVNVTPLQMTAATAAIANKGTLYRPHVVDALLNRDGSTRQQIEPAIINDHIASRDVFTDVIKGMRLTVTAGTAQILNSVPVPTAAKTGTAQTGSLTKPTHAWFTAFAPVDNPRIAITVMVEYGGEGSSAAAPIARDLLNGYFIRNPSATSTPNQ